MSRPSNEVDLEVYREHEGRWVLRVFGGDPSHAPFAVTDTKDAMEPIAAAVATFIAAAWNADGSCEVYSRRLDGTFDRNTYPRSEDPPETKG